MFAGGSWKSESAVLKMLDLPLVCIVTADKFKISGSVFPIKCVLCSFNAKKEGQKYLNIKTKKVCK